MLHFLKYKITKLKLYDNQLIYINGNIRGKTICIVDKNRVNI